MARPGEIYGGACGRTRTEPTHFSCTCGLTFVVDAHRSVNVTRDPVLGQKLRDGTLGQVVCPACGTAASLEIPVVYHDEQKRQMILVLPPALRHRELEERAELLLAMARDRGFPVPGYARELQVAFGTAGLGHKLETMTTTDPDRDRAAGLAGREAAVATREAAASAKEASLSKRDQELALRAADLSARVAELERRITEVGRRDAELAELAAALHEKKMDLDRQVANGAREKASASASGEIPIAGLVERALFGVGDRAPSPSRAGEAEGRGSPKAVETAAAEPAAAPSAPAEAAPVASGDDVTTPIARVDAAERVATTARPPGAGAGRHKRETLRNMAVPPVRDPAVERWMHTRAPTAHLIDRGRARLLTRLTPDRLGAYLTGRVSARVQLHRTPSYPLIVIAVTGEGGAEPLPFHFDLSRGDDRQVLGTLAQGFRFILDIHDPEYLPAVQRDVEGPLEANVRHVLAAAEAHLTQIPVLKRSFEAAITAWRAPSFDRWGRREHGLEEDSFHLLSSAASTAKALDLVAHWSEPENEDYLLLTRSFPIDWWRRIRSRVAKRCLELGLRLPDAVAELAVVESLARSKKELVQRTAAAFTELVAVQGKHDLDKEQVAANWRALIAASEAAGTTLEPRSVELAAVALGGVPPSPAIPVPRLDAGRRPPTLPEAAPPAGPRSSIPLVVVQPRPGTGGPAPSPSSSFGPSPMSAGEPNGGGAGAVAAPARAGTGVPSPGSLAGAGPGAPLGSGPPPRTRPSVSHPEVAPPGRTTGRLETPALRPRMPTPVPTVRAPEAVASAAASASAAVTSPVVPPAPPPAAAPAAPPPPASSALTPRPVLADLRDVDANDLMEQLDDKDLRLGAGLELCRRVEPQAVGPVFGALRRMTRGEAVRVLPAMVEFGERAVPHLVDGLRSRKAYLRQGCALALGVLKSGEGIEPLCDLLLGEPTDVWREIARAIGEVGGGAVMSLAARLRDPAAQEPEIRERISWALAHVSGHGGRAAVETLAAGRDITAAGAARRALELAGSARDQDDDLHGSTPPRDVTLNRAFSRRFFETMAARPSGKPDGDEPEILEGDEEWLEDDDLLPG
jgi:CpXC motif protein